MAGRGKVDSMAEQRKAELVEQLAIARETMRHSKALLKESFDVKQKLVHGVKNNSGKIMAGSAISTLLLTSLFRKKKYVEGRKEKKGLTRWLVEKAASLVVRRAKSIVFNRVKDSVVKRIQHQDVEH